MPLTIGDHVNEDSHPYRILQNYLTSFPQHLQLSPNDPPITDFVSHVEQTATDLETPLWTCWRAVANHIAQIPLAQTQKRQQLLNFVLALQRRRDLVLSNGDVAETQDGQVVWSDLPLFRAQMEESRDHSDALPAEYLDFHAFLATFMHTVHSTMETIPECLDMSSLFTFQLISRGLDKLFYADTFFIRAACVCFLCAAPTLRRLCRDGKMYDGKLARVGIWEEHPEPKGYCEERWGVWKAALESTRGRSEVRRFEGLIEMALVAMEEAERGSETVAWVSCRSAALAYDGASRRFD